jgi:hypothetical protein
MAHFADIGEDNVVRRVLVVPDSEEHRGHTFLAFDLSLGGNWIQTSYSAKIRKNFAGIGFTYSEEHDAFIPPQPYESWSLDLNDFMWYPPKTRPKIEVGKMHLWNEGILDWEEFIIPDTEV